MGEKKLQAKDFITVGIYAAILAAISLVVSFTMFIPIFIVISAFIIPVIDGIPFMLFATKIKRFGMISLMGILAGIINCVMGMGIYTIPTGIVFGILADIVLLSGNYKSRVKAVLGYGVYSMWTIGNYITIVLTRESYYDMLIDSGMTQEYLDKISKYVPDQSLIWLLIVSFIGGIVGGLIGLRMHKKHFERAGIIK